MTPGRAACPPPHPVNLEVVPRTSEGRGWRLVFKHLEPSTRSRSTLGQGFGAQPFHPQAWKARRAVQIPEGGGWAQAQILSVACFSVGTPGRAVGSALARTAWSPSAPPRSSSLQMVPPRLPPPCCTLLSHPACSPKCPHLRPSLTLWPCRPGSAFPLHLSVL